jgi:hypothetical protein
MSRTGTFTWLMLFETSRRTSLSCLNDINFKSNRIFKNKIPKRLFDDGILDECVFVFNKFSDFTMLFTYLEDFKMLCYE